MRRMAAFACAVMLICLGALPSYAEKRVALVIGNSAYQNTPALPNPKSDATDMAAALQPLGFEVVLATDLDKRGMDDAFRRFARLARDADAALFFYAGHGLQYAGTNYLMPVDAKLQDEADLPYEMAKVDDIIADLSRAKNIRIVILDACRDNPMAERLRVSLPASRSAAVSRGLARIERTQGLITAFATQPGQVAADGFGKRNSPFTTAILKHIATAGIEAGTLFRRVAQDVNESTGGKQLPELSVSLLGEFYFAGQGAGSPTGAAQPPADQAAQAWATTQNTTSVAVLEDFVRQFGSTVYGSMARARLEELRRAQVGGVAAFLPQPAPNQQAAVAPPAQPAPAPTPFHFDFTPPSSNQQAAVTPSAQPVPGPSPTLASSGQLATATPLECSAYITNIHRDWDSSVVRAACAAEAPASGPYMVSFSDPLKEKYYSCHSYLKALSGSERITNCTDFI